MVSKEPLVPREFLVKMDVMENLETLENRDPLVELDFLVSVVSLDLEELQVHPEKVESLVALGPQVLTVQEVSQEKVAVLVM